MHPNSGTNFHMSSSVQIGIYLSYLETVKPLYHARAIRLTNKVILFNVLYVPGLTVDLISTSATPMVYEWTINPNNMVLRNRKSKAIYFTAPRKDGLYEATFQTGASHQSNIMELHRKLGHAGRNTMGRIIAQGLGSGRQISNISNAQLVSLSTIWISNKRPHLTNKSLLISGVLPRGSLILCH